MIEVSFIPGIMIGVEYYEDDTDYRAVIIDLFFIRIVIDV